MALAALFTHSGRLRSSIVSDRGVEVSYEKSERTRGTESGKRNRESALDEQKVKVCAHTRLRYPRFEKFRDLVTSCDLPPGITHEVQSVCRCHCACVSQLDK